MTHETLKNIGKYSVRRPLSGGKAGKGKNSTSNIQIINLETNCLEKNFSFQVDNTNSFLSAKQKAFDYCFKNS